MNTRPNDMVTLYLVRHGRAAAAWDTDPDPGLDQTGQQEAHAAAQALVTTGAVSLISSPLRRTRETAAAFESRLGPAQIEPRVAEIPSPGIDLTARSTWLKGIMGQRWSELGVELQAWRKSVIDALLGMKVDSIVATHFIAINVAVGYAQDDDRVLIFQPANGTVTSLQSDGKNLRLLNLGQEGSGRIL